LPLGPYLLVGRKPSSIPRTKGFRQFCIGAAGNSFLKLNPAKGMRKKCRRMPIVKKRERLPSDSSEDALRKKNIRNPTGSGFHTEKKGEGRGGSVLFHLFLRTPAEIGSGLPPRFSAVVRKGRKGGCSSPLSLHCWWEGGNGERRKER